MIHNKYNMSECQLKICHFIVSKENMINFVIESKFLREFTLLRTLLSKHIITYIAYYVY